MHYITYKNKNTSLGKDDRPPKATAQFGETTGNELHIAGLKVQISGVEIARLPVHRLLPQGILRTAGAGKGRPVLDHSVAEQTGLPEGRQQLRHKEVEDVLAVADAHPGGNVKAGHHIFRHRLHQSVGVDAVGGGQPPGQLLAEDDARTDEDHVAPDGADGRSEVGR